MKSKPFDSKKHNGEVMGGFNLYLSLQQKDVVKKKNVLLRFFL